MATSERRHISGKMRKTMNLSARKHRILAAADFLIVFMTLFALIVMYCGLDISQLLSAKGISMLKYFTVDANFLTVFAAILAFPHEIRASRDPSHKLPRGILLLLFACVVSLALTFLTVIFFLGPLLGWKKICEGSNLVMHLIMPVFVTGLFIWSGYGKHLRRQDLYVGLIPTILYGTGYLIHILMTDTSFGQHGNDWYGFAQWGVGMMAPVLLAAIGITWLITLAVWKIAGGGKTSRQKIV